MKDNNKAVVEHEPTAKYKAKIEIPDKGFIYVMDITPEFAKALLRNNHERQRKVSRKHVDKLNRSMAGNKWAWIGEAYQVDCSGFLINGQHRLTAQVEANITLEDQILVVVFDDKALLVIDAEAKKRSEAQARKMGGAEYLTTSTRAGILLEAYDFVPNRYAGLSTDEKNAIYNACPFMAEAKDLRADHMSAGVIAVAIRCMRSDRDAAYKFFKSVAVGNFLVDGVDAPQTKFLWMWINRQRLRKVSQAGGYITRSVNASIRTWNAWRRGATIGSIKFEEKNPRPTIRS